MAGGVACLFVCLARPDLHLDTQASGIGESFHSSIHPFIQNLHTSSVEVISISVFSAAFLKREGSVVGFTTFKKGRGDSISPSFYGGIHGCFVWQVKI